MNPKLNNDAVQVATHIINGDFNVAQDLFSRTLTGLKHFEAVVLRDRIHEIVADHEKTGAQMASYFVSKNA